MLIHAVERLSQDELAGIGAVANVQIVWDSAPCIGHCSVDHGPGRSGVHAPDYEIKLIRNLVSLGDMLGLSIPLQTPEEIQPVNENN